MILASDPHASDYSYWNSQAKMFATLSRESLSGSRDSVSKVGNGSSLTETGTQEEAQP